MLAILYGDFNLAIGIHNINIGNFGETMLLSSLEMRRSIITRPFVSRITFNNCAF